MKRRRLEEGRYKLPGEGVEREAEDERLKKGKNNKTKEDQEVDLPRVGRHGKEIERKPKEPMQRGEEDGPQKEEKSWAKEQDQEAPSPALERDEEGRWSWVATPLKKSWTFAKRWARGRANTGERRRELEAKGTKAAVGDLYLPSPKSGGGLVAATTGPFFPRAQDPTGASADMMEAGGPMAECSLKKDECTSEAWGSMGFVINWLNRVADEFNEKFRKPSTTGRLFPLPSSPKLLAKLFPHSTQVGRTALRVLVLSLNSLNGEGIAEQERANPYQGKVLENLLVDCERVSTWKFEAAPANWEQFFNTKSVDYKGDEILTAQPMCWENVSPALPTEVGGVKLEEVVELGCKHYVLNFEEYLLDEDDQVLCKPPRVMVPPEAWRDFCSNLIRLGVFSVIHEDDIYRVKGEPVLNGLFGVSKQEFSNSFEVMRIIMNLIPLNGICREFAGDVGTLPAWAGMSPLQLHPHEDLVVSSEDVRCFFYIFKVPNSWHKFLAFNRPLPEGLGGSRAGKYYPCSAVLPMGFKNSVSLAQHVHRFIVKKSLAFCQTVGGESELRKDRTFPSSQGMYRIYLDNYDLLEKTSCEFAKTLKGSVSPLIESLREQYLALGVPRHPKKSVSRQQVAEVQGAVLDGHLGIAHPKIEKVLKYVYLAYLLLRSAASSQRQMQVVGGGLVYIAMFRRPLLGGLNHIWQFIISCEGYPPVVKLPIPREVKVEISQFLGMIPIAYMNFRRAISPCVTASDASEYGGGVTASQNVSPVGAVASGLPIRGDLVEPSDLPNVLTIGLFDGIGALRVAVDALGWCIAGHISVEKDAAAARVVQSNFAGSVHFEDVTSVTLDVAKGWAQQFTQVSLVLIGAGPPCQGVSGLNASRKGALKDERSCLFSHVPRIRDLVKQAFPWAQIKALMESVASMDGEDEDVMSSAFGEKPWRIDAAGISLAHRPRYYWVEWELQDGEGVSFHHTPAGQRSIHLEANLDASCFLEPGWRKISDGYFCTFTTSRPRAEPGFKPAGLKHCNMSDVHRWKQDAHRFPPYQYQEKFLVTNSKGEKRPPSIREREVIMGFPKDYTVACLAKRDQGSQKHLDTRLSLIGNSWNVTVVAWLLAHLGNVLGLNDALSLEEIVKRTSPASSTSLQSFLHRPAMSIRRKTRVPAQAKRLVEKLLTMVSVKGEDLLLQHASEDLVKYHRMRASVPAKLWSWKTVASWAWTGSPEHINALELRAVLTALRWRLERHQQINVKFLHLIDSMVALHSLSRGRSSSRKLRRTVLRINALLLATKSQCVWAYVHTKQNPADEPSRRPGKRKWAKCQNGF